MKSLDGKCWRKLTATGRFSASRVMAIIWNRDAVADGLEEIRLCRASVHSHFKELLDSYHGEARSTAYYDVLAGDWLETFAHVTYAAWREVRAGTQPPLESQPIPVAADLIAYGRMSWQRDGLHEHLRWAVACLLEGDSPAEWDFEESGICISSGGRERMPFRLLHGVATAHPDVLLTAPYYKCSHAEWVGAILRWRGWLAWDNLQYPVNISATLDQAWRRSQAAIVAPIGNLCDVLRALLPLHIPVALLEGFAAYRAAVLTLPVARPKAVYSANALHQHLMFKLFVAEWQQHGTQLLYHQHGGGYGIDRAHIVEDYEVRVSDRYYTWGWRRKEAHVKPLSAPPPYAPMRKRKRVLLSCGDFPNLVYRLQFFPMPGTIETMRRETCAFLAALPDHRDLLIRPYPNDYGGEFVSSMYKVAPDADFDDGQVSPFVRFSESRLVVHNYFSTGLLETLALDVPTLCFFDPDAYAFRDVAQPWIDALEQAGILHCSGISAAHFAVGLGGNVQAWWNRPEVQAARLDFVRCYACFSSDWKSQWRLEFESVLDEKR